MSYQRKKSVFLYQASAEKILSNIHAGSYVNGKLPTEKLLAEQLSISVVTLRKSLDCLEQQGYIQRRHGSGTYIKGWHKQGHKNAKTKTGFINYIPCAGSEYIIGSIFCYMLQTIQKLAAESDYSCVISQPHVHKVPTPITKAQVDAVIVAGDYYPHDFVHPVPSQWVALNEHVRTDNQSYIKSLVESGIPVVGIANHAQHFLFHSMTVDYQQAFNEAIACLKDNGHKRIAYCGGNNLWPEFQEREQAFRQAMHVHGLSLSEEDVCTYPSHGGLREDVIIKRLADLLQVDAAPTALIIGSGSMRKVYSALQAVGKSVNEDLSCISVVECPEMTGPQDAISEYNRIEENVGRINVPAQKLASAAMQRALHIIQGRDVPIAQRNVSLPAVFERRGSIAAI